MLLRKPRGISEPTRDASLKIAAYPAPKQDLQPSLLLMVRQRSRRNTAKRSYTVACRVSLLVPAGRRTCRWYLATCPACLRPHLGRAKELAGVPGRRKLPCGHWVDVVVARTYGRTGPGAAA